MCDSVEAVLRARGAPIPVGGLGKECPLPVSMPGKLVEVLKSEKRFELQDLGSAKPMVSMRQTSPMAEAEATSVTAAREKWISRCDHSLQI